MGYPSISTYCAMDNLNCMVDPDLAVLKPIEMLSIIQCSVKFNWSYVTLELCHLEYVALLALLHT